MIKRPIRAAAAMFVACGVSIAAAGLVRAQTATITLRSGVAAPAGEIVAIHSEGVVLRAPVTGDLVVPWHHVRSVPEPHIAAAEPFRERADMLWRARARLARGDLPAAEPLFEELFVEHAGSRGPTSAAVAEGLLRCRLERGAHTLAVSAWLAWLEARRPEGGARWFESEAVEMSPLVTDPETGLVPELPPIWLDLPAVRVFGTAPLLTEAFGERERTLAELYQHAARGASGGTDPLPGLDQADAGVRLVRDIVAAHSAVAEERAAARRALDARFRDNQAGWRHAWLSTAIGRSLLRESSTEDRQRGVLHLLRVRITHDRDAPYLAGLALAEAAVAMHTLGDADGAALLRRELLDVFPGHPATSWERIANWPPVANNDPLGQQPSRHAGDPPAHNRSAVTETPIGSPNA